jgi:hypothetical protein
MVSAQARRSAPFCPRFLRCRFRVTFGYRALDPRPRASCTPRFHAKRRQALLWVRLPPNDFCNHIPDARTRPRTSDSRAIRGMALPNPTKPLSLSPRLFEHDDLPPSREDHKGYEPRQPFRNRPHGAASTPKSTTPEVTDRSRRRLRATPRPNHRLRRWPLDVDAGLRGPNHPERRTFPPAACCRRTTWAKVPLLI